MNNENSENKETNIGLNVVSLGSVDNNGAPNLDIPINDIPPISPDNNLEVLTNKENNLGLDNNMSDIPPVNPIGNEPILESKEPEVLDSLDMSGSNNNVETLGVVSNTVNNPAPVEPIMPVASNEMDAPIPPLNTINYDIPEVANPMPTFSDIGTIPPIPDSPVPPPVVNKDGTVSDNPAPKNSGGSKIIFVLIVVLVLAAVGVGVYIFLSLGNQAKVIIKDVKVEVGSEVSTDIKDYATFNRIDSSLCSLDTTKITDTKEIDAEYEFIINCEGTNYRGKVIIVDTVAPEVTLMDVNVGLESTIKPEDFIAECKDSTECSYAFKDEKKVEEQLKKADSYHVPIIVKDASGNEIEVTGVLVVNETPKADFYLTCVAAEGAHLDKYAIIGTDWTGNIIREYYQNFIDKEEYEEYKNEHINDAGLYSLMDNSIIPGKVIWDDENERATLIQYLKKEDIEDIYDNNLPTGYNELKATVEVPIYYECSIGF